MLRITAVRAVRSPYGYVHSGRGRVALSPLALSLIIWAGLVAGALGGVVLRRALPDHHLDTHAKDIVRLGCALIATIAGLVLGLLVNSANTSFNTQRDEVRQLAANMILIDLMLDQYGPDARPARALLRAAIPAIVDRLWVDENAASPPPSIANRGPTEVAFRAVRALKPADEEQRYFQAQALQAFTSASHTRYILFEQSGSNILTPFLVVLVFWLVLLFASFSLFSPMSPVAVGALVLIALSVSGAIFLILEMYSPFGGLMQIDPAPLRNALVPLG